MIGVWTFTLKDKEGKVLSKEVKENDITYLGVGYVLDNALGRSNIVPFSAGSTWLAVGTGSQTYTDWISGLGTEVSGAGNLGRILTTTNSRVGYRALVSVSFDTTIGSGALNEAGIFVKGYASGNSLSEPSNALNTGMLFNYVTYGVINKDENNTLQIDVEIKKNA
jgi:hypothetical protein